ncbi:MAG: hypothetical protein ACRETG_05885, partial [Steroidobacteraceae bacterium]
DMQFCINEATLIALCGLVVCSIFLSLQEFEIFYCLNVFANAVLYTSSNKSADGTEGSASKSARPGRQRVPSVVTSGAAAGRRGRPVGDVGARQGGR